MNRPQQLSDPSSDEQASLWAVRLEGSELTASDRAELEAWLAAEPARRDALSRYCTLSARLERILPEMAAAGTIVMPRSRPSRFAWTPWRLAAAGLAAAAIAWAVWFSVARTPRETLSMPVGQRGWFTLGDGSRVELNANTSIFVENGNAERRVRLANGEAFFVVSKDQARPFIVETPAGSVRVTGTIFNVLTESSSQLVVTVVEGSVQVRPGKASASPGGGLYALRAGGQLCAGGGAVEVRSLSDSQVDDALAWRRGQIVCEGEMGLSTALDRLAHYHGLTITVSAAAAGYHPGGIYSLEDVDDFLAQIEKSLPVRADHDPSGAIRVHLRTEP